MRSPLRKVIGAARRRLTPAEPGPPRPIYAFTHHKTGSVLLSKVLGDVAHAFRWRSETHLRWTDERPAADVAQFMTSQVGPHVLAGDFRGVHVVRDPRDLVVSGAAYHRRCAEAWCVNTDFDATAPIGFPRVPYSQERRPEEWKRRYLADLAGRSYQEHLRDLDNDDGLLYEMRRYALWTTEQMLAWDYTDPRIIEVKMEDLAADFDGAWARIFSHLGLTESQQAAGLRIAAAHDLGRMDRSTRAAMSHVSSADPVSWRDEFGPAHRAEYAARFGAAHTHLGYPD